MGMGDMQKTIKINVTTSENLWPYEVVNEIQKVMEKGLKKYPEGEGWEQTADFHVARAISHISNYLAGRKKEDNLAHALTRLMMAVAIERGYGQTEFDAMVAERDKEVDGA